MISDTAVVIVAAGSSTRMQNGKKKEFLPLGTGTVLSESVKPFLKALKCDYLLIVVKKNGEKDATNALFSDDAIKNLLQKNKTSLFFVEGGDTRQESVYNALEKLSGLDVRTVLIHDGARPFVDEETILRVFNAAKKYNATVASVEPVDTQKIVDEEGFIKTHLKRSEMVAVQTPQGFDFEKLKIAHENAKRDNFECTDDTEIFEKYFGRVKVVQGNENNKKITYSKDYDLCHFDRSEQISFANGVEKSLNSEFRTGFGYDIHRLTEGRKLVLGGVVLPFEKGEEGHSDGDALLHAITDAVLGAVGLGDIGSFFPDTDEKYKNADSRKLLKMAWKKVKENGWKLCNLDCVIKLEKPKFLPYREKVIESIAETLEVEKNQVFVKAKTAEKMGEVGKSEAVEAWVTCLLQNN